MLRVGPYDEGEGGTGVAPLVAVAVVATEVPDAGGGVADFRRRDEGNRESMPD